MIKLNLFLAGVTVLFLTACSEQRVKPDQPEQVELSENQKSLVKELENAAKNVPPKTTIKASKNLNLVRAMEGGACKNDQQGILGMFLLYADQDAIERIKRNEGTTIFSDFEMRIEAFSMTALQEAVQNTDFPEQSSLPDKKSQQQVFQEITRHFRFAVEPSINNFQNETTLTIEVTPFQSSYVLYTYDCAKNLNQAEQ